MCVCLAKVEGEIGKEMFIIETGMVEASVASESCPHAKGASTCAHCVMLGRQGPKSFFGELAVMGVREWQRRYAADALLLAAAV
jgi:CRP-like cAMP-binding protein|eukprot:COSAG02_NODE_1432_length_12646_cov_3.566988_12_plen_84_part_00